MFTHGLQLLALAYLIRAEALANESEFLAMLALVLLTSGAAQTAYGATIRLFEQFGGIVTPPAPPAP